LPSDTLPPEVAALLEILPAEHQLPPEVLAAMVLPRLALANAVLTVWSYVLQPEFLDDIFTRNHGRSYEDILSFSTFVALMRDALVLYRGSALQSIQHADEDGLAPTCQEAVYGKLRRVPIKLSLAFMEEITQRIRALMPPDVQAEPQPASLVGMTVVVLDGKQIKRVAKRLKPVRGRPGKVIGGKILVAYVPAEGMAVAMAADPDGEANDIRLMPEAVPRARARIIGIRLWIADRQFCDLKQPERFTEQGDHFLLRRSLKLSFSVDPERPAREPVDAQGRTVIEQWGWIGAANEKRRRYVRQIHLVRPGEESIYLVTDLLDGQTYPAGDLLAVYLKRWEIERVFQKITEVFHLERLVGSTPEATVFQAAFCLVLYNLLQLMRAYAAAGQKDLAVESVSMEQLFRDVEREMTGLGVLFPAATIAGWYRAEWSREDVMARLRILMGAAWRPRYRKAVNKKTRPKVKQAKCSGAHTSVHKVREAARKQRRERSGDT
jgi:Transposase DDE domain